MRLIATVNEGKRCRTSKYDRDLIVCTYSVGNDLVIEITGIGDQKAAIAFPKVDEAKNNTYLAKVGLFDGCVRVSAAGGPIAFISPKDGKVYPAAGPWCSWFAR